MQSQIKGTLKLIALIAIIGVVIFGLSHIIGEDDLDHLKYNLSLWTIIALVIIINLVSFICFLIMMMAYKWIRPDFKNNAAKHDILED